MLYFQCYYFSTYCFCFFFFFFNDTATTEIYTLSLHDALPIYLHRDGVCLYFNQSGNSWSQPQRLKVDRKSTRLNSSHVRISYAVFCLKKKKNTKIPSPPKQKKKKKTKQ